MKVTLGQLRLAIAEIAASHVYAKKERIREDLQSLVASRVADGSVRNERELKMFMDDVVMALGALKMIPYDVWVRLSSTRR